MKLEELQAYELIEGRKSKDLNSMVYLMRHKKTGARVVLISNDDSNKVFYIGFRTPPTDSTGVAHIIEHTVLCGSDKYPAKDPFIELAKGSLNTFLNAMTYPDKTVYPVASCNDKDFANLMDVYLDSVFHPNIYKEEKIFMQEGWHYEMETPESDLTYNGVVYNEMKGVFSSPDDIVDREIMNSLFPDNSYGVESGGDPEVIPELTYEMFLDFHRKYYHPSNSYIYLYGDMDMAERLQYLDEEYLSKYEALDVDSEIKEQIPFSEPQYLEKTYPIMDSESEEHNTYLSYNVSLRDGLDEDRYCALSVLDYALFSTPGAPVRKALIDKGIGKDVYSSYEPGIKQPFFSVVAKEADKEQKDIFVETIENVIKEQIEKGIDQRALMSAINYMEFKYREADFGSHPKGLIRGLNMFDSWLYDDKKPFIHLEAERTYASLKEKAKQGYFEKLLDECFLQNTHKTIVMVSPEKGMAGKKEKELADFLKAKKDKMSEEEIAAVVKQTKDLHAYQEEPSSKEDLEKIPHLTREDIKREIEPIINEMREIDGTPILYHNIFTNGIGYLRFIFDIKNLPEEYYPYVGLLKAFIGLTDTENYSYGDLFNEIHLQTGGIGYGAVSYNNVQDLEDYKLTFEVKVKTLYDKLEAATELIKEVLVRAKYDDYKRLKELIEESKSRAQASMVSAGHSTAATRALSYVSRLAAISTSMNGIPMLRLLEDLENNFDEKKEELASMLAKTARAVFRADNLMVDYTGEETGYEKIPACVQSVKEVLFKEKVVGDGFKFVPEKKNEGFMTAGQVQYVCRAGNFREKGLPFTGALRVMKVMMGYEYLWNKVRVKGGAYGCMSNFGRSGDSYMVSYRDPNLMKTVEAYEGAVEFLENYEADEETMTKYIIGTMSELDVPLTPSAKGVHGLTVYMSNMEPEMLQKERDEVLNVTVEDIRKLGAYVKAVLDDNCFCVVGTEEKINAHKEEFGTIEQLIH